MVFEIKLKGNKAVYKMLRGKVRMTRKGTPLVQECCELPGLKGFKSSSCLRKLHQDLLVGESAMHVQDVIFCLVFL